LLVAIIGAAMLTWFCSKRRKMKVRYILVAGITLVALVYTADFILVHRNSGYEEISYDTESLQTVKIDNNFATLGETIRVVPSEADYAGFEFPLYVLVRPIPRVFCPNKPVNGGFDLTEHLGMRGLILSIMKIGETYSS